MIALRMALVTLIGVCAAVTYDKGTFNGASLIGVLAVGALVATSMRLQAFVSSLVEDAHGQAASERTVLDVLDRPAPHMHVEYADGTRVESGMEAVTRSRFDDCPCPVDHTDACPFDDDERPAA